MTGHEATSAEEYFNRNLLGIHKSSGIDDLGPIKYDLAACLALVYVIMYLCICNGVKSTGKAVYVILSTLFTFSVVEIMRKLGKMT